MVFYAECNSYYNEKLYLGMACLVRIHEWEKNPTYSIYEHLFKPIANKDLLEQLDYS